MRGIIQGEWLYVYNFEASRWPAGNPETGYLNTDGSPTKTVILDGRTTATAQPFWKWSFGKRPVEELYHITNDPDCVRNLATDPGFADRKRAMQEQTFAELKQQQDPRMLGQGEIFDLYPYADSSGRGFYERFMKGEKPRAPWVNQSDFETEPLE